MLKTLLWPTAMLIGVSILYVSSSNSLALALNINESCVTPHNATGVCRRLGDCQYLLDLLSKGNISEAERQLLRGSSCGNDANETSATRRVLVCCSNRLWKTQGNVLPEPGECGVQGIGNRIFGGQTTLIDEFPWLAQIKYRKPYDVFTFICGGVLINSRYVLTAAHCVNSSSLPTTWSLDSVRFGDWNTTTNPDCDIDMQGHSDCAPEYVEVAVETAITHPNYVLGDINQYYDIGLIRLVQPVTYSDFIQPICLPLSADWQTKTYKDQAFDIAGWGATENLPRSDVKMKAVIKMHDMATCALKYKELNVVINGTQQLCAIGEEGVDSCRGDSGGPLMLGEMSHKHNVYFAIGIVSFGPAPCAFKNWPGIYLRISPFLNWITSNLRV